MKIITTAHTTSSASPSAFFAKWGDMATWPEWNADTEWVRLDGPFIQGATGTLKPKGGPKVRFTVDTLVPNETFVDVSRLVGARLTFDHRVSTVTGETSIKVTISMHGPMTWFWRRILGGGFRKTAQADLNALAEAAERLESGIHTGAIATP